MNSGNLFCLTGWQLHGTFITFFRWSGSYFLYFNYSILGAQCCSGGVFTTILKSPIKTTNSYKIQWLQIQKLILNTESVEESLPWRRCSSREVSTRNCSVTYIFSFNLLPDYSLNPSRPEMCMYERRSVCCKLVL